MRTPLRWYPRYRQHPELARLTDELLPPEIARSIYRLPQRVVRREARHFEKVRRAETSYAVQLRNLARNIGQLITGLPPTPDALPQMMELLNRYSIMIAPWARATAVRMIAEVARRDAYAWFRVSREIGANLRLMIEETPLGHHVQRLLDDQVELISSMPTDAGLQVQEKVQDLVVSGRRYDELIPFIREAMGDVAHNTVTRATLIGRTETAKCQSAIVQARAQHVGSDQYIWRTVRDNAVRPEHRLLEGTVQRWDDPPVAEARGDRHHPGNFPNCRCYAEPILPAVII